jgi:hypothetical protein
MFERDIVFLRQSRPRNLVGEVLPAPDITQ